jgi:peroxiredoxin
MLSHPLVDRKVPRATFRVRVRDESAGGDNPYRWQDLTTDEVFSGRNVVLFALPGAFTPVCSSAHAPGYQARYPDFRQLGVDEVVCLSVNDAFVMRQWAERLDLDDLLMLPDGNAEFTRKMGMLVRKENLGFGLRSWRYSMHVKDGVIRQIFVEPGFSDDCPDDPLEVSDAETMLEHLRKAQYGPVEQPSVPTS